jgi:ABC-type uncharacterized transport system substrate-binding protein
MRRFLAACGALAFLLGGMTGAVAHPHVWVDTQSAFIFDDRGHVRAIKIIWRFDELYSAFSIQGSDANQDGATDQTELQALADNNVKFLAEWNYFTDIKAGLADAEIGEVTTYGVADENGTLVLWYELPLEFPVDVSKVVLRFRSYDPSYYVAFDADPSVKVELVGTAPADCRARAAAAGERPENVSDSIVNSMTADAGWAAAFAPVVSISCG